MTQEQPCHECRKPIDTPMGNGDGYLRCIKCSTEKYKRDRPWWSVQVYKNPVITIPLDNMS